MYCRPLLRGTITTAFTLVSIASFLSMSVQAADAPQGLPAEVVKARIDTITGDISAIGTLRANESTILRPELTGSVEVISFTEGGPVAKGSILIQLNDDQYKAQVNEAAARVRQSEAENRRIQKLFKNGVGSETDRDSALAQMQINEAQLDLAKISLEKTRIRAPFDGIAGLRTFSPGDYINAGTNLIEVIDVKRMKIDFSVPETYLQSISIGQPIQLKLAAFPGEIFTGNISAISPVISEKGRSIQIRGEIDNSEQRLRPGLFAEVILTTASKEMLTLPEEAMIPQGDSYFVYRVNNKTIEMIPVTIIQRHNGRVVISGPLSEGDVVVTAGQLKLQPGSPVTPIFVDGSQPPEAEAGSDSK